MPHIHELIDYTAEIFIVHQHKVLIRLHDKYNLRTCPWGHVELDENPNEAAVREAKEETGLDVVLYSKHQKYFGQNAGQKELIPPVFMNIHRIWNTNHQHIWLVYFASAVTDRVDPGLDSDASHVRKWMSKEDIETADYLLDHVKVYARAALEAYA